MITQCPACTTMFKVVPDQLRISDGWVRCGQCNEVFDANAYLQQEPSPSSAAPTSVTEPPISDKAAKASETHEPVADFSAGEAPDFVGPHEDLSAGFLEEGDLEPQEVAQPTAEQVQPMDSAVEPVVADEPAGDTPEDASFDDALDHALDVRPADAWSGTVHSDTLIADPLHVVPGDDLEPMPRFVQAAAPAVAESDDIKLSFMRQPSAPAAGRSRMARWGWGLLSLVLGLGLAAQWLIFERDRLVAAEAGLRGPLDAMCGLVGCTVRPLRQIESIVIDSSAFTKVNGDLYRLTVVLKNAAAYELAAPSLELSVTDAQDQTLIRRVLQPADLGNKVGTLAPHAEWSVSMTMALKQAAGAERIAGYRLLAFYP